MTSKKTVWWQRIRHFRRRLREYGDFEGKQGLNPEKQEKIRVFGGPYVVRMDIFMGLRGSGPSLRYSVAGGSELILISAEICIWVASAMSSSTDSLPR